MTTFVLVHGGGHGGWCWQRVARLLRAGGHEVHAPTLTGFGERHHLAGEGITFETFVTDVVNLLEFEDLTDVVLVGHSMGGTIIPRVAEQVPGRLSAVVWLCAVVTADGETLLDAVPQTEWTARAVRLQDDGTPVTDPELIVEAILQDGTPADRAWVLARHRDYSKDALVEPGRLTAFLELGLPTAYIATTDDHAVPVERGRVFAARLGTSNWREIPGSHDVMISRPEVVAEALVDVAETCTIPTGEGPR